MTEEDTPPGGFNFPTKTNKSKLFSILGVSSTATRSEIKSAYREKAKKLHPDVVSRAKDDDGENSKSDDEEQNAKFLELKTRTSNSPIEDQTTTTKKRKGPIFGPGMRARMNAAKKMREARANRWKNASGERVERGRKRPPNEQQKDENDDNGERTRREEKRV